MTKHPMIRLIKISRPIFWVIFPLSYLIGLSYGPDGLFHPEFRFTWIMIAQMVLLSFPFCILTFGLNDIHDIASDSINPRKIKEKGVTSLSEGTVFKGVDQPVLYLASLLVAVGMVIVSLLSKNMLNLFYTISLLTLSFTYSTPPWRLKTKPPLDSIVAGVLACLAPAAMGYSLADINGFIPGQIYLLTFAAMGFHAFSTIMDVTPDKEAGDQTFAVRFGKRPAALFAAGTTLLLLTSVQMTIFKGFLAGVLLIYLFTALFPSEKAVRILTIMIYFLFVIMALFWLFVV